MPLDILQHGDGPVVLLLYGDSAAGVLGGTACSQRDDAVYPLLLEVGGESVRGGLPRRYHPHELLQCRCVAPGGRDAGDVLHPECLFYVFSYIFCHITARKPDE